MRKGDIFRYDVHGPAGRVDREGQISQPACQADFGSTGFCMAVSGRQHAHASGSIDCGVGFDAARHDGDAHLLFPQRSHEVGCKTRFNRDDPGSTGRFQVLAHVQSTTKL